MNRKIYLIVLIFILPMFAGWFLYFYHDHFHFKTLNHGTLVNPAIDAQYLDTEKEKKWRMIYLFNTVCDEQCKKIDYQLHQIQKALGKNHHRVRVITMSGSSLQLQKLQTTFLEHQTGFIVQNKIYLVDPRGFLFMYYPSNTDPMNILKDLKKVLEISQIG